LKKVVFFTIVLSVLLMNLSSCGTIKEVGKTNTSSATSTLFVSSSAVHSSNVISNHSALSSVISSSVLSNVSKNTKNSAVTSNKAIKTSSLATINSSSELSTIDSSSEAETTESPISRIRKSETFPNYDGKETKILILGNSFVNSSTVGIMIDMLAKEKGQKLEVTFVSRGMYNATLFYNDIDQFPLINSGYYDVIFMCGVYSLTDVGAINNFVDILSGTKTNIILFPADNEDSGNVMTSLLTNPKVGCANWDLTLDELKKDGFTEENLNYNDSFKHSNQLAGYVGACNIYSFLFKKIPDSYSTANYIIDKFGSLVPGTNRDEKMNSLKKIEEKANYIIQYIFIL
jgi:hypothetical protein